MIGEHYESLPEIYLVCCAIASACALAQETPAQNDPTAPSAASSPHQRQSTTTTATEAPANQSPEPAASSSPHQREATQYGEQGQKNMAQHDQMMKDCITKHQKSDTSMTKDAAKKACTEQMKSKQSTRG